MREQRQDSEWIMSSERGLRLKLVSTKDLYYHLFFCSGDRCCHRICQIRVL